jgi:hypothetical protein
MGNVILLSASGSWDVGKNFKLTVNGKTPNLLSSDYRRIAGLPKEGGSAEIIARVLF